MINRGSDRAYPARGRAALRPLLVAVWIGGPMWKVDEVVFHNLSFFGEGPSQDNVLAAVRGLATGAAIAAGVPVIGLLMGRLVGDRQAVREWAVRLSVGLLAAAVLISVRQEYLRHHQVTPAPTPTRPVCREYSGGPPACPGG